MTGVMKLNGFEMAKSKNWHFKTVKYCRVSIEG